MANLELKENIDIFKDWFLADIETCVGIYDNQIMNEFCSYLQILARDLPEGLLPHPTVITHKLINKIPDDIFMQIAQDLKTSKVV